MLDCLYLCFFLFLFYPFFLIFLNKLLNLFRAFLRIILLIFRYLFLLFIFYAISFNLLIFFFHFFLHLFLVIKSRTFRNVYEIYLAKELNSPSIYSPKFIQSRRKISWYSLLWVIYFFLHHLRVIIRNLI